jgi:hypothetical protein
MKDDDPVQLRMDDIYDHSFVSIILTVSARNITYSVSLATRIYRELFPEDENIVIQPIYCYDHDFVTRQTH